MNVIRLFIHTAQLLAVFLKRDFLKPSKTIQNNNLEQNLLNDENEGSFNSFFLTGLWYCL